MDKFSKFRQHNHIVILTRHILTVQIPSQKQPLGHGQQLCEASSKSKLLIKSYGLDKWHARDFLLVNLGPL